MKRRVGAFFLVAGVIVACTACGPDQRILDSANSNSVQANNASASPASDSVPSLERDIEAMRNADFYFIYVFHRKDGGVLDADDRKFMSAVIPGEINRRTISDGGRALICGSNFRIPPGAWKEMKVRFNFEDYSRPESEIMGANANGGPKR